MKGQLRQVLAAVDNSPYALCVARWGAQVAARSGAELVLLHVIEARLINAPLLADLSGALGASPAVNLVEDVTAALRERGRNTLAATTEVAAELGVTARAVLEVGVFSEVVSSLAKEANLLIMGRRGHDAEHGKYNLGGDAERVLRSVGCSCLVLPAVFQLPEVLLVGLHDSVQSRQAASWAEFMADIFVGVRVHAVHVREKEGLHDFNQEQVAGVPVTVVDGTPEGRLIAECNNDPARTLCLIGATGHKRTLREFLLGTVPLHILHQTRNAVLIAR
jgi:nucleotide-binding universal stress UspA family protein